MANKNKTVTIAISVIMMLAMTISMALPLANAQEPRRQKTYPYIEATPNPVGVGEQVLIKLGISQLLGLVNMGWEGLTVEVETPDGHTITLDNGGPGYRTDSTGGTAFIWTFDEVGTYKLRTIFPEQEVQEYFEDFERGRVPFPEGTVMLGSETDWIELVVTEEPNVDYPGQPLPAEYWTRPIDPQLRMWSLISGSWRERGRNSYVLYNDDAPETAHVLWTKELTTGGLTGGIWYPDVPASSETGDAYEGKFSGSIVLNGILYYRIATDPGEVDATVAVDLHTGEELWTMGDQTYSFGMILYFNSFNYDGVFTYLVETGSVSDNRSTPQNEGYSWYKFYDPFNAVQQFEFTNVPSGTRFWGPSGEILILEINYNNHWMALWNSTKAGLAHITAVGSSQGSWGNSVHGNTWNTSSANCYTWNVTLGNTDTRYQTSVTFGAPAMGIYLDEGVVTGLWYNQSGCRIWSVDFDGHERFDKWWNAPNEWEDGFVTLHVGGVSDFYEGGFIFVWEKETRQHYAFSVETGNYMWVTDSEWWSDWYGWGSAEHTWYVYEDHLYSTGVGGILYAYNIANGETDWTYELTDAYNEPVTGTRWWGWITLIADGKIYLGTCEHSAEQPLPRGAPLACINASNGAEIFRVNGMYRATRWGGNAVMGDSIYATMDTYDQRVYAVGKGPSATKICCNDQVVGLGGSIVVSGYVTDISPGTEDYGLRARFPNGVPAVSDGNMSDWMLYVWKQFAKPADVIGVDVTISLIDPNGNTPTVATVTADEDGFYKLMFEPEVPGEYTVIASFDGSNAYYGSHAKTAFGVVDVPTTPVPEEGTYGSLADSTILPATIGIIVAIIVIGLVIILMLRKR